jgi:hypothetical protein
LLDSKRLRRFALTFPHRRDIVLDTTRLGSRGNEADYFVERPLTEGTRSPLIDEKVPILVYVYRMPDKVEKLEATDRRDPMAR